MLEKARSALGNGSSSNRQAIIPMTNATAGDPRNSRQFIDKSWSGGSMYWNDDNDIDSFKASCEGVTAGTSRGNNDTQL